jgi:hypothetical protein
MKKYRFFITISCIYVVLIVVKYFQIPVNQYVSSYFADLLCLPILLSLATFFLQKVRLDEHFQLTIKMIFFVWLYVSIVFEVILPHFSTRYTADIWDVVAYSIGGIVFKSMNYEG